MLGKFRNHLENLLTPPEAVSNFDPSKLVNSAAAALLIEAAESDSNFSDKELILIKNALSRQLGVHLTQVEDILLEAQKTLDKATCLYEITSVINEHWELSQKIELVEAMWKIVLSDHYLDPHENHLMRKIKGLLYIPQADYISAKIRAQRSVQSAT